MYVEPCFSDDGQYIYKIVLTGGPCAGKTESLEMLCNFFRELGYDVFVVNETATELINNGISARTMGNPDFQRIQMKLQLAKEQAYMELAESRIASYNGKRKAIVFCDRGTPDGEAFSRGTEFQDVLHEFNLTKQDLFNGYDGVLYMRSVAVDAPHLYTRGNNTARTETIEQAAYADMLIEAAYRGCPNVIVVDNSTNLQGKVERGINGICRNVLHIEEPFKQYIHINTLETQSIPRGRLVVMTGPSGVGKTTAAKSLEGKVDFETPPSYTTRQPREGEVDGVDYHFVDRDKFNAIQLSNGFLETAEFNGNLYGTSKDDVEWALKSGKNVLLDLEIQGVKSVKQIFPDSVTVFMEAPNDQIWEERLKSRGSETPESLNRRIQQGKEDRKEYINIPGEAIHITCTTVQETAEQLGRAISGDQDFRMKDEMPKKQNLRTKVDGLKRTQQQSHSEKDIISEKKKSNSDPSGRG